MSLELQNKIEQIRNESKQYGNTRKRVADVLTQINQEKIDKSNINDITRQVVSEVQTSSGWYATFEEPEATLVDGTKVVLKKVTGYKGGTGEIPPVLSENIGKYYAKGGGFTTDVNLATNYKGLKGDGNGATIADEYDKSNGTDALSAKVTDAHLFGGFVNPIISEVTMLPNWNPDLIAGSAAIGVKYIPEHALFAEDQTISEITFNGFGSIDLYTCDSNYQNLTKVKSLNLTIDGNNTFSGLNIDLLANNRLGICLTSGTFRFSNTPVGATKTWGSNTAKVENISLAFKFKRLPKTTPFVPGVIPEMITEEVSEQIKNVDFSQSNLNKLLFSDDFSTQKNSWIPTAWNFDAPNKKWTSTVTGRSNRLFLNRIYNLNKRKATFRIVPSADTDFRIELRNGLSGVVDGESMFSINFAEQKLKIFNVLLASFPNANVESNGVSETSILQEVPLNIPYVSGREYTVELRYEETLHTLSVIDTISGAKTTLTQDGWVGGRQQQSYSFYVFSGGIISIKDFKVFALENFFDVVFVGDSITEGVMVQDKSKRWWKLMEPFIDGKIAVCARGGHTVQDVIDKFPYELAILKPKYAVFLIGINGYDSTVAKYSQIKMLCETNGIIPIFCYINAVTSKAHIAINQNIIAAVGLKNIGFRFDLATSINNDGINYNSSLYYDGAHPKETGTAEMFKRVFIDLPEILK